MNIHQEDRVYVQYLEKGFKRYEAALSHYGSNPYCRHANVSNGLIEETTRIAGLFLGDKVVIGHRRDLSGNQGDILSVGNQVYREIKSSY